MIEPRLVRGRHLIPTSTSTEGLTSVNEPYGHNHHVAPPRRRRAHMLLAPFVLLIVSLAQASSPDDTPPRVIVRLDAALLAILNGGPNGGGGIFVPPDGTGAGLGGGSGAEFGVEVRIFRWIALDAGVGRYGTTLDVGRDRGLDARVDSRSAPVDLKAVSVGLVVTPPKWRTSLVCAGFGALVMRADISDAPPELEISIDDGGNAAGFDFRADFLFSKNRHWGIGVALAFVNLDPRFVDQQSGEEDSLQVSGMFLRLGVRGAW